MNAIKQDSPASGLAKFRKLELPWIEPPTNRRQLLWRHSANPIIGRRYRPGVQGIYNSAVIPFENQYAGVFRYESTNRFPRLHVGFSPDGVNWEIAPEPIKYSGGGFDNSWDDYAYDPRVCQIDGDYFITWCGGHNGPTISVAKTSDFEQFERLENAFLPFNRNGVLFPTRIGGNFLMLSRPSDNGHTPFGDIYISQSPDMCHWGRHRLVMRSGGCEQGQWWQRTKIGAGPIPIAIDDGWLMIYHGVMDTCNGFVYSIGAAILDRDEPWNVLYRTDQHIMTPEAEYEVYGHVPNVVFPCAAVIDEPSDRISVYYGAADTYSCVACGYISELIRFTKDNSCVF